MKLGWDEVDRGRREWESTMTGRGRKERRRKKREERVGVTNTKAHASTSTHLQEACLLVRLEGSSKRFGFFVGQDEHSDFRDHSRASTLHWWPDLLGPCGQLVVADWDDGRPGRAAVLVRVTVRNFVRVPVDGIPIGA